MPKRRHPALLEQRGHEWELGSYVTGLCFNRDGNQLAVALSDGRLLLSNADLREDSFTSLQAHLGSCLSLAVDPKGNGFLSGGDDGCLAEIDTAGRMTLIGQFSPHWIEHIAVSLKSKIIACTAGKSVYVYLPDHREKPLSGDHPSTLGGIVFATDGQRIAASHYGGVTIWDLHHGMGKADTLCWKGSHLAIAWSPDQRFIVTAMQENHLHVWHLADKEDLYMSGYASKVKSMSWTANGDYLATSGHFQLLSWPFMDNGPQGREPLVQLTPRGSLVTMTAAHPAANLCAVGFDDGLVWLCALGETKGAALLRNPDDGPISALAWSASGNQLAIGTATGKLGIILFSGRSE